MFSKKIILMTFFYGLSIENLSENGNFWIQEIISEFMNDKECDSNGENDIEESKSTSKI